MMLTSSMDALSFTCVSTPQAWRIAMPYGESGIHMDADGLAHLAEVAFFRAVRVKEFDGILTRTLVGARTRLVRNSTELSNQIRGIMNHFASERGRSSAGVTAGRIVRAGPLRS
jgi:hypothetical protein